MLFDISDQIVQLFSLNSTALPVLYIMSSMNVLYFMSYGTVLNVSCVSLIPLECVARDDVMSSFWPAILCVCAASRSSHPCASDNCSKPCMLNYNNNTNDALYIQYA